MIAGRPVTPPVVHEVMPDSAAEAAGLQPGDRIVDIDGATVETFEEMRDIVILSPEKTMAVGPAARRAANRPASHAAGARGDR